MRSVLFYAVWLGVISSSLALAIARFEAYGIWGVAAIVMAVGMLALFVVDHVRPGKPKSRIRVQAQKKFPQMWEGFPRPNARTSGSSWSPDGTASHIGLVT